MADVRRAVVGEQVDAVEGGVGGDPAGDGGGRGAGEDEVDGGAEAGADGLAGATELAARVLIERRGDAVADLAGQARRGEAVGEGERAKVIDDGVEDGFAEGAEGVERGGLAGDVVDRGAGGDGVVPGLAALDQVAVLEVATAGGIEIDDGGHREARR